MFAKTRTFYSSLATVLDVNDCYVKASRYVVAVSIRARWFTMNRVDYDVKRWIKAVGVLGNELDTVENRNLVKWNVKTSCNIFNLTS